MGNVMDSKIIAAIIIGVAMVTSVYLYTQDTAYNRCVTATMDIKLFEGWSPKGAKEFSTVICNGEHLRDFAK